MDEQDIDVDESGRVLRWIVIGLLVVLVLVGIGAVGKFAGTGWFGWRQFAYDGGTLYAASRMRDKDRCEGSFHKAIAGLLLICRLLA